MSAVVRLFVGLFFLTLVTAQLSFHQPRLLARATPTLTNVSGVIQVLDPTTSSVVAQTSASDGGGSNYDLPALIWIGFSLGFGLPLAGAGIRGWRLTTAASTSLAAAVCAWAAFINTVNAPGISDILLTIIVLGFAFLGFVFGLFEFARLGAIAVLGLLGGLAFGIRIVIIKQGLLLSSESLYAVNWVVPGLFAAGGGLILIWAQRTGILFGCASVGTFLLALALDLIISKQAGMSRGLRFLFDRNDSHFADIIINGYVPSLLTRIILYSSLGLTPALAYAQHRIFKDPFNRRPVISDAELAIDDDKQSWTPWAAPDNKPPKDNSRFSV